VNVVKQYLLHGHENVKGTRFIGNKQSVSCIHLHHSDTLKASSKTKATLLLVTKELETLSNLSDIFLNF